MTIAMMPMLRTMAMAGALASLPLTVHHAAAEDCTRRGQSAVSGTLVSPAPCKPAKAAPAEQPRENKRERGVIRHGNTTIYYGGSIQSDTAIRGR